MDAKTAAALDEVPPQSLGERTRFWNGFLYGEYDVGKTIVTARLAKKKGLVIATDEGVNAVFNHPELVDKIEVVPYAGLSQLTAIAQAKTEGYGKYAEFDLIWADTISQMQEEYLDWLSENFSFSGNTRTIATPKAGVKGPDGKPLKSEEIIGLADYNLTRRKFSPPIKALIKAPVNVMFLAHLREPNFLEQQKGKVIRRPTLTETVFKLVAREMTFMGLMEKDGTKRTIQFKSDKKTVSKSQIKAIADKTVTDDEFVKAIQDWEVGK